MDSKTFQVKHVIPNIRPLQIHIFRDVSNSLNQDLWSKLKALCLLSKFAFGDSDNPDLFVFDFDDENKFIEAQSYLKNNGYKEDINNRGN